MIMIVLIFSKIYNNKLGCWIWDFSIGRLCKKIKKNYNNRNKWEEGSK